ncbi:hypothetical protein B0A50_00272 [Salinomyces thailandicus]|uniref:Fumarylacetoacetase-like C-terminal domain-containing protein n=1 Tax=Salinomyces thailandicus TaxID=706561 RepID=A0A4U0UH02_9PEZI|nr:hypothetical protein B0A50_00272 [Salinomyces thailandica]
MSTTTTNPVTHWDRLIRYVSAKDSQTRYGDPIIPATDAKNPDIDALALKGGLRVKVLEGPTPVRAKPTGEEDEVGRLLGPLTPEDVAVVRCTGLNYRSHKTGFDLPANPTLFLKPRTTITDTRHSIPIPPLAQSQCDYEGELTIVIGRSGKNIPEASALDYVAGYTCGNDVSCRDWQMEKPKAGMMPQWCFSKSFDEYAPCGPCVVSTQVLGDAAGLGLRTLVNGEVRQESNTGDLVFGVRRLVSFFSQGQTLEEGSVIMTGTPGGVGLGFKPPRWLKDGDEVVVEIEGVGKVVNRMKFE